MIKIRECEFNDIDLWIKLNEDFMKYEITDEVFWNETLSVQKENLRNIFVEALENKENIKLMMIENNGDVIGFINLMIIFSVWAGGKSLILDDLFIIEEYRNMGFGKVVMNSLECYAGDSGYKRLQFLSEISNKSANDFYKKLGYEFQRMNFYMKYL